MAGYDLPVKAIRQQVSSALDMICHIERLEDGSRRVTAVTEVAHGVRRDHAAGHLRVQDRVVRTGRHDQRSAPADRAPPGVPAQVREARDRPPPRGSSRTVPPANVADLVDESALRWIVPAVVAALAAFATTPVFAADDSDTAGVEVVEAGSALFPDRAYVMTFPAARGQLAPGT